MSEQKYTLSGAGFSPSDNSKPAGFNWLSQQWESLIAREAEIGQDQDDLRKIQEKIILYTNA